MDQVAYYLVYMLGMAFAYGCILGLIKTGEGFRSNNVEPLTAVGTVLAGIFACSLINTGLSGYAPFTVGGINVLALAHVVTLVWAAVHILRPQPALNRS